MIELIEKWSEIDWKNINRKVTKLRGRIYQAKRFRKIRNLQAIMLKSTANTLYSIRKIRANTGRNTPEIDGETLTTQDD